jgi:hypothetical protein
MGVVSKRRITLGHARKKTMSLDEADEGHRQYGILRRGGL